ncbi:hypothetical protein RB601_003930 [Gaeumannomyces tritici]
MPPKKAKSAGSKPARAEPSSTPLSSLSTADPEGATTGARSNTKPKVAPHVPAEAPQGAVMSGDKPPEPTNGKEQAADKPPTKVQRTQGHPIFVEPSFGLLKALRDPDAYLRHVCQGMVEKRPWVSFDEVYNALKCTCAVHTDSQTPSKAIRKGGKFGCQMNSENIPSFGITSDFPASHRTFRDYNTFLGYLSRLRFSGHSTWRELIAANGEIPFPPVFFTRGFFAARTALGHGTKRFTLGGSRRGKQRESVLVNAKLAFLHHDPNKSEGKVDPFWEGFIEHHTRQWESIKPVVDEVLRERKKTSAADESKAGMKRKRQGRTESNSDRDVRLQKAMKSLLEAIPQKVDPPNPHNSDQEMAEVPAQKLDSPSPDAPDETTISHLQPDDNQEMAEENVQKGASKEGPAKDAAVQLETGEEVDNDEDHNRTCTDGLNDDDSISPRTPKHGHQDSDTEEERIQAELRQDLPASGPSDKGKNPADTSQRAMPTPPAALPDLSAESAEQWRRIAQAVAESHLRLKVLMEHPGSHLITHDGLPYYNNAAGTHSPRAASAPAQQQRQSDGPGTGRGDPRTPGRRTQGRGVMLVSPVNVKVETPSTVCAVRRTPATTASSETLVSEVFYTPRGMTPSPTKRPRLE